MAKTVIDSSTSASLNISELFRFKNLLWNLSVRDVLVRYKQTAIGIVWAVARPLINIVIFGFFSQFIEKTSDVAERFISVSAGVIIWGLVSATISEVSNSLISNSNILTKVYFPRLIIPLSSVLVCLIDFSISFVILLVCKLFMSGFPGPEFFIFPLVALYALIFSFAIGLFFATLNVRYRDIKFLLPFLLQVGFYVCPVFLSTEFFLRNLPESLKPIYLLNPLVTIVDGFKFAMTGQAFLVPGVYVAGGFIVMLLLLWTGLIYFNKVEKTFADFI